MKRAKGTGVQEIETRLAEVGERARETGRSLWLASIGLAVTVGENAAQVFDGLVAKGRKRGTAELAAAERAATRARKSLGKRASELAATAEEGMGVVFHRLGLPTRNEVDALSERVDRLTHELGRRRPARRAA